MPGKKKGIFASLGHAVMNGRLNGSSGNGYGPGYAPSFNDFLQAQNPPPPPPAPMQAPATQLNPAERAVIQAQVKEGKEVKEQADGRVAHKGTRKSYIPLWGEWPTKQEAIDTLNKQREKALQVFEMEARSMEPASVAEKRKNLLAELARNEFSVMKQYNLSKHEPVPYYKGHFGGISYPYNSASDFLSGGYARDKEGRQDYGNPIKGWKYMSPAEQEELMNKESEIKNMRRLKKLFPMPEQEEQNKQTKQNQAQLREYEQQTAQETQRYANLSPAEREQENYNRQVAEYLGQQHRHEYENRAQFINQNKKVQEQSGLSRDVTLSQPVMNELISMINSQPTRYVPFRPRPSVNDRVMNSFEQNMFSPEFISEEERWE